MNYKWKFYKEGIWYDRLSTVLTATTPDSIIGLTTTGLLGCTSLNVWMHRGYSNGVLINDLAIGGHTPQFPLDKDYKVKE